MLATQKIDLLNPTAVLHRGYAVVKTSDGRLVSHVSQVGIENRLNVVLSSGQLGVIVTDVKEREGDD